MQQVDDALPAPPLASVSGRANTVRYSILGLISLLYLVVYLEKANISVVAPEIAKIYHIDKIHMGWIFSAYVLAYAFGLLPAGWLADRLGPRRVICIMVPFWSLTTILTGFANGFVSLVTLRFFTGMGSSGTFSVSTRALHPWFYPSERGTIHGLSHACARLGGAIVPPLVVWLMLILGWRWVFYVCGAIGLCWASAFFLLYRDTPAEHSGLSPDERLRLSGLIAAPRAAKVPWAQILRAPNTWFVTVAFACYGYSSYFFVAWLPSYLVDYRHLSMKQMSIAAALPLLAGMLGNIFAGFTGDYILRRTGNLTLARRSIAISGLLGAALFIVPAALSTSPVSVVIYMALSVFFMEFINAPAWAVTMDIGGNFSGTVSSIMNLGANMVGSMSPLVFGYLAQNNHWLLPFFIQAGILVMGALIWAFLIHPERPIAVPASAAVTA